ncbi:peptide-methionine (S)-S-oxide reductase [Hathewaya proteolytica DSM 3090]|uniref:Peptide methionine sulfoxide reductase MsrA n=1 Tax=Hathewaya proteolytica DSM 3090 TaxID=1121331 RepID=A0A1M6P7G4_9CLOT|nr:peptide-methionine (S)-S-oxide reductase MsrA [Hathewaya proteolytica]SHK03820.1 peptide-methionine (S)-S-oxide reductase [Hathewaya proteolytica DSM 3090]
MENNISTATFAGGCFWCMVDCFYLLEGVVDVVVGYAGGKEKNPTYKDVKSQNTSHREVARVYFHENVTSYEELLHMFWRQIDPTDNGGQFQDRGHSYTSAIFYENERQKELAEKSKLQLEESGKFQNPIVTDILPLVNFNVAEEYHQNFSTTHKDEYKVDRSISGRDEFINKMWK